LIRPKTIFTADGLLSQERGESPVKRAVFSLALALLIVAAYAVPVSTLRLPAVHAQWSNPQSDVPPYHDGPPAPGQALPPILHGSQLTGPYFRQAWQVAVYKEAAQIPQVLYQLPCLCGCERGLGHTSLHSCFEGTHGAICDTCAAEEAYAYRMTKRGWTVQQIRAGIEHHAYESIDLNNLGKS
jgi:Protein of unknown function with PCYCGC motif